MVISSASTLFSVDSLYDAWRACRRRKRSRQSAIAFEMRLFDELSTLSEELESRVWQPRPAVRFATTRPKLREIVAAQFRDRVVHHLYVQQVEPHWERVFIHDSFACRTGKGTHAAVDRLSRFIRSVGPRGFYLQLDLQLDLRSFFMSIDREKLFTRIDRGLRRAAGFALGLNPLRRSDTVVGAQQVLALGTGPGDERAQRDYEALRWLSRRLICCDWRNCIENGGNEALLARIPSHKTLAGCAPGRGLPIGNLTSQFFANVYLDALDQFVKHELKVRYYLRYVDDFVLLHTDPEQLRCGYARIESFLADVLGLRLNEARTRLLPVCSGVDFLGYVVHPTHRLVRRRVVGNLRGALSVMERAIQDPTERGDLVLHRFAERDMVRLESSMNSWMAHLAKADTHRLTQSLWRRFPWLDVVLARRGAVVHRTDRPPRPVRGFRRQYRYFQRMAGSGLLLLQMGSHFELLGAQALQYGPVLGLRPLPDRVGMRGRAGFPQRRLKRYLVGALARGIPVVIVRETGRRDGRLKERRIVARWLPRAQKGQRI